MVYGARGTIASTAPAWNTFRTIIPLEGVSLERRRDRRNLGPPPEDLLFGSSLERSDPISKKAVRLDRKRRQSRRGLQRVLLLSGFHADTLVHEVHVQVSAGVIPYEPFGSGNRSRGRDKREFEMIDTGVLRSAATSTSLRSDARPSSDDF